MSVNHSHSDLLNLHILFFRFCKAGNTALVGSSVTDRTEDAGATTWAVTVAADNGTDELTVDVTGEAAHTIDWNVRVELLSV